MVLLKYNQIKSFIPIAFLKFNPILRSPFNHSSTTLLLSL